MTTPLIVLTNVIWSVVSRDGCASLLSPSTREVRRFRLNQLTMTSIYSRSTCANICIFKNTLPSCLVCAACVFACALLPCRACAHVAAMCGREDNKSSVVCLASHVYAVVCEAILGQRVSETGPGPVQQHSWICFSIDWDSGKEKLRPDKIGAGSFAFETFSPSLHSIHISNYNTSL